MLKIIFLILSNTPENIVICINQNNSENLIQIINEKLCPTIYCGEDWKTKKKTILENNTCIETYNIDSAWEADISTNNSINLSDIVNDISENTELNYIYNTEKDLLDKIIICDELVNNSNINKICNLNSKKSSYLELISQINSGVFQDLFKLIINTENNLTIKKSNKVYQMVTLSNQNKCKNISFIDLSKCEKELRRIYNINPNEEIILFKKETYYEEYKIPIIEYEFFHKMEKSTMI